MAGYEVERGLFRIVMFVTAPINDAAYSCDFRLRGNGPFLNKAGEHELTIDELDTVSGGFDFSISFGTTTISAYQFYGPSGQVTCISAQNGGGGGITSCTVPG